MSLFKRFLKPKRLRIEPFGFPPRAPIASPSSQARTLKGLQFVVFIELGLIVGLALFALIQIVMVISKADIIPYVSDGGGFGCKVPKFNSDSVPKTMLKFNILQDGGR